MRRSVGRRGLSDSDESDSSDSNRRGRGRRQTRENHEEVNEAIQILQFENVEDDDSVDFNFNDNAFTNVLKQCKGLPIHIISIIGSFQTGRSLFLNLLKSRLEALEDNESTGNWLKHGKVLSGFEWKNSYNPVTKGIWIWGRPFILEGDEGKVAVLIMDTQGFHDEHTSPEELSTILGITMMASSTVIFNLTGDISADIFTKLQPFLEYADIVSENGVEDSPLPKLSFLIRDWKEPDIHAFGARGGSAFLQEKKQQLSRQIRQQIKDSFDLLDCFLLPHIGEKALTDSFTGSTDDMNEEFGQKIKLFVNRLTKDENLTPKISLGSAITAEDFFQFTQAYVELYKKANQTQEIVDADDIYKVTREINQDLIIKKCMAAYRHIFSTQEETARYLHKNAIDVTHTQAQATANLIFKRCNVVKSFKKDFQKTLEKQAKKAWEDLKEKHVSLRQKLVTEAIENEANLYRETLEKKLPFLSDTNNGAEQKFYEDAIIQNISKEAKKPAILRFRENFPEEEEENLGALTMSLENVLTSILDKFENENESRRRNAEDILGAMLQKLVESYKAKMKAQFERRNICDMAQLEQCHDLIMDNLIEKFDDTAKPGTEDFLQNFADELKQLLISEMEEFKFQLEAKLDEEMGMAEGFVKSEVDKYEVKLQEKIEFDDADEDDLQLFHKSFTEDVLKSFEETSSFPSNSPQDRKVRSRIADLLGSAYKKHVDEGVVARRKLEEKFQNILESSLTSYVDEMKEFMKEIHESGQLVYKDELETKHVDALENALDTYDIMAKDVKDKTGVLSQQQRSKLEEKVHQVYKNLLCDATRRIELAQTNAATLVGESINIYKDQMEASITRLTSDEELKKRHDLLSNEAYTYFMDGTLVKDKEFLEEYLETIRKEIAEIFNEMEEVFSLTRRKDDQDIREAVSEARKFYNAEMPKFLSGKASLDPAKLHEIHGKVSKQALERILTKNPKLTESQQQSVEIALGKSYLKFREENEIRINADKEPVIGIDLGTTYSCVGVYVGGEVKIIPNAHGNNTTPSYVAFEEDGSVTVGQAAKNTAFRNAEATIFDAKRMIGRKMDDEKLQNDMKFWPFNVIEEDGVPVIEARGKTHHPENISGILLRHLKEEAEKFLNGTIQKAVITVPAYFNDGQRQATVDAGKIAGLDVLTILNEPSAAAIAYKLKRFHDDPRCILVFDFGGGTFDAALVHMEGSEIKVKAVDGDTHLGGEDIDKRMMEHCAKEFLKASGKDLLKEKGTIAGRQRIRRLQTECENRKKDLSVPRARGTEIVLDCVVDGTDLSVKITKKQFEEMNLALFQKSIEIVDRLLQSAHVNKGSIDDIVLIGGTTRIPSLQDMLSIHFGGKALNSSINPDEAVAYGAAVQAAILNGQDEARQRYNLQGVHDVTPMSLGIEIVGGSLDVIIAKNTPIPTEHHQRYRTHRDNQPNAHFKIYQGEILEEAKQNTLLGEFTLNGIPPAPGGKEEVDVRMYIDNMGILHVSATSKGSLQTNSLTVDSRKDRLTEEKIEQYKEQGKQIRFIDCQ